VIVDSSALLAILFAEPDRERFAAALEADPGPRLSTVNFVEAAARVDMGGNPIASDAFDDLIREAGIGVEPVTAEQAHLACRAYRAYGRGSGSPARLNLGDCFAYALAKATGEPLLFKGDDFGHTDLEPALAGRVVAHDHASSINDRKRTARPTDRQS
jgi:ribonuclease VapC